MNIKKSILKLAFVSLLLPTVFSAQTSTLTEAEKLEAKKKAEALKKKKAEDKKRKQELDKAAEEMMLEDELAEEGWH